MKFKESFRLELNDWGFGEPRVLCPWQHLSGICPCPVGRRAVCPPAPTPTSRCCFLCALLLVLTLFTSIVHATSKWIHPLISIEYRICFVVQLILWLDLVPNDLVFVFYCVPCKAQEIRILLALRKYMACSLYVKYICI